MGKAAREEEEDVMVHKLSVRRMILLTFFASTGFAQPSAQNFDDILAGLEDSTVGVRIEAAAKLAELGKEATAAVPALVKLLDDPSPDARTVAALALGEIGSDDDMVIQGLLSRLDDAELRSDDVPVWAYAARALGQLGPKSAPQLIAKLSGDNRTGRRAAAVALHDIKPPQKQAVPALIELLVQNEPETRIAAMYAIIGLDPKPAASAIPTLQVMLGSDDFHTQYWACRTIAAVGPPQALPTLDKLVELTASGVASVRSNAAEAIGIIGPAVGKRPIAALTTMLHDDNYVVRRAGVIALGRLGTLSAESTATVKEAMQDPSRSIRAECACTLWQITGEHKESLPVLLEVIQEKNAPWEAAMAFQRLGAAGKPAVPKLSELLTSKSGETQYFATLAISGIGPAAVDALPALRALLESPDDDMRQVAAGVIEKLQGQ
ncbi:MAG: HEAT repeat domain-containing protein [Planctomycetaceae bacterium]|nr:HEAT repeat domain-containing protein [Planctomycetales bacterium]MCB9923532.1 HEAT repeat domain-containing protein [Planctomycetaceae bacterium]